VTKEEHWRSDGRFEAAKKAAKNKKKAFLELLYFEKRLAMKVLSFL